MFNQIPILSFLLWHGVIGAIVILFCGDKNPRRARVIALITAGIGLLLSWQLYVTFDPQQIGMQLVENLPWIPMFKLNYSLGVDGISVAMILLTTLINFLLSVLSWQLVKEKVSQYLAVFLLMQSMLIGIFSAMDSILFYVFWEAVLIPLYLCIGMWGSKDRAYAAMKFFLFTFFGSALFLIALLYLGHKANSFDLMALVKLKLTLNEQILLFIAFFMAFAIKVPMWPVHTWLPDAHTEAPAAGSVMLAALMLKVGAYGFIRFSLPITPDASAFFAWPMVILSLIAIVYIGLIALAQVDMKRLIAYSSVAHMGFVTLGCFGIYLIPRVVGNVQPAIMGLEGAVVQMIAHAFGSGAMFLAFGLLYAQVHTRLIADFGGIAKVMPHFAACFLIFCMNNVGLPGTSGFVGEFMVILSMMQANFWIALTAATTLVIGASYTLWMYKRVFYGQLLSANFKNLQDIEVAEWGVMLVLIMAIFAIGLYPNLILDMIHQASQQLLQFAMTSKLGT